MGPFGPMVGGPMTVIQPLLESDADVVADLWRECGLVRPWNDPNSDFLRALASASSTVLGAHEGDPVIATVMVGDDGHRGWVYYVAVDPGHQGRGIGHDLMTAAEHWLTDRGLSKAMLMVRDTNTAVVGFYEGQGYSPSATRVYERWLDGRR